MDCSYRATSKSVSDFKMLFLIILTACLFAVTHAGCPMRPTVEQTSAPRTLGDGDYKVFISGQTNGYIPDAIYTISLKGRVSRSKSRRVEFNFVKNEFRKKRIKHDQLRRDEGAFSIAKSSCTRLNVKRGKYFRSPRSREIATVHALHPDGALAARAEQSRGARRLLPAVPGLLDHLQRGLHQYDLRGHGLPEDGGNTVARPPSLPPRTNLRLCGKEKRV